MNSVPFPIGRAISLAEGMANRGVGTVEYPWRDEFYFGETGLPTTHNLRQDSSQSSPLNSCMVKEL